MAVSLTAIIIESCGELALATSIFTTPFWELTDSVATFVHFHAATEDDPHAVSIINRNEAQDVRAAAQQRDTRIWKIRPLRPDEMLTIQLRLTAPGYTPDYFFDSGFSFVSARFREVADLPQDKVQYLDVICDPCTADAKAKGYKVLWVHHSEDVLDPGKTVLPAKGTRRTPADYKAHPDIYVYKSGFQVSSPIFYLADRPGVMVTDALARRLLDAGLDLGFWDLTTMTPDGPRRLEDSYRPGSRENL